ncbi:hypothetical protein Q1695_014694 [Nippostrongylus brasiliensis]|nr:hypothetical protein Q1695_014694 [Nippostrongylus brasiliensis]
MARQDARAGKLGSRLILWAPGSSKHVVQKPKRKKERHKGNDIDDYSEAGFWERILNSQDCGWPTVQKMLEHLTTQWKIHVEEAGITATEYNSKANEKGELIDELEQEEISTMIKTASKQKERITSISNRFVQCPSCPRIKRKGLESRSNRLNKE